MVETGERGRDSGRDWEKERQRGIETGRDRVRDRGRDGERERKIWVETGRGRKR